MIDNHHCLLNNIKDLQGNLIREKCYIIQFIFLLFSRPGSAYGDASARLGSHRPSSRAYGNFDHQQAIYANRHGNLLV